MHVSEVAHRERSPLPMVTVVIPTRNRREMLRAGLESLLCQSYPKDRYEVMVVDNGSSDGTDEMVTEMEVRSDRLIRYLRQENRGPAMARNRGIREGKGEIVAFTDSDCLAHPDWLKAGVHALLQGDRIGLISGRVLPVTGKPVTFLTRTVRRDGESLSYPTCNIFYRRTALEQVGGFAASFMHHQTFRNTSVGGEDADLGWRVKRVGWKSGFAPEAVVYHEVCRVGLLEKLLLEPWHSQVLPYLAHEYPEIRGFMFLRYFLRLETALVDLVMIGVILAACVSPLFLLLCLGLPARLAWEVRTHEQNRLFKFVFLHAYWAVAVMFLAYGSIRYRSLLL